MQKKCIKCGVEKLVTDFNFKNREKNKRHVQCKKCTRSAVRLAYRKNRRHYLEYRVIYNKELREKTRQFKFNYLLEHPCVDCGEDDPIVLEFDHVRGKKLKPVSALASSNASLEAIKKEIKKCEVRCRNCHARKTAQQLGYYQDNI